MYSVVLLAALSVTPNWGDGGCGNCGSYGGRGYYGNGYGGWSGNGNGNWVIGAGYACGQGVAGGYGGYYGYYPYGGSPYHLIPTPPAAKEAPKADMPPKEAPKPDLPPKDKDAPKP
jgi:hypothetical protein